MESLRRAAPKRKRPAKPNRPASRRAPVERTRGTLAALVPGAPRGLAIAGDLAALDSLDADELARIARRVR